MSAPLEPPARAKPASLPTTVGTVLAVSRAAAAGVVAVPASSERFLLVQRNACGKGALGKFACTSLAKIKQKTPRGWGVPWVLIPCPPPPQKKAARERKTLIPPTNGGRGGTWLMLPILV